MADPLSISASIAGLVTLADTVFLRLTKYIKSVQSADKEIKDLCKEVNLLGGAVNMLARLARGHELEDEPFNRDFRMYHIEACALILNDISQKTKKYDGNSKSKLLKLKWPYESSITKGLLADLSRHKDNINLALTANSMDALLRCLAKEEDRAKATATIRADVKKTREIFVRIQEDKKRTEVLRFFLHYNPQPNYEMSVKLRHPRTGMWLDRLPAFQTWLSSGASRIWLSGIPGAGKTVLADFIIGQALARSSDTVASGFFFCDYKNEKTQTPANVLGALAHQLARQNEQAYVILEEYHKELNPKNGLPRSLDSDDLVRVIVTMAQKFKKVYLVVDGLDECQDSTEDVVRALCVISESSEAISMALLSRNEDNIRDHLQDPNRCFENIQIAAHTEDITEYVTSEIQQRIDNKKLYLQDLSLKGEIVDSLVDGAKGMFRWVACQLDHLGYCMSDEQCREALRSLPPDLPETYLRILRRVPRAHQMHVQLILNCIAFAKPRLTIAQLREMLSVPSKGSLLKSSGLIHGDAITRYCSSLVRRANDRDHLEFAHFSVQEYLLSNDLMLSEFEMFSISKRRFNRLLALRSLEYVQLDNFDHSPTSTPEEVSYMEKRDFQYPFYEYAARNWLCYAREEWDDPKLLAAAARLFDLRKSSMFTSWAVTLVLYLRRHCMKDQMAIIAEIIDKRFTPIHLAATMALPEVVSILLRHGTRFQIERHIGSPFNYAVDCLYGAARHLSGYIRELRHISFMPPYIGNKASDYHFTLPTIKVLFEYYDSVPKGLMGLGLRTWMLTDDFSVLELLVVHDAALLESDLEDFSFHARELVRVGTSSWDAQRMRSLCGFCETLSAVIENSALHFELCRQAWELALQLAENTEHLQNIRIDPRISEDEKSLDSLALSACLNLHIDNLSWVVNDKRLSPSSIQSNNGNGLLHNLVLAQRSKKDMHLVVRALDVLLKAGCSLSTKNDDGHTPLSLALDRGDTPLVKTLLARVEIEQGAWQSKVPILLSVAQLGSEEVLDKLLDLGFEVLTTAYETNTPLHCLSLKSNLAMVKRFEDLLPGSRSLRIQRKLPWESYLFATSFECRPDVLDFLIQPFLVDSECFEAAKIWEHHVTNSSYYVDDSVVQNFVKVGILRHYETVQSRSGLLSFASIFSASLQEGKSFKLPFTDSTMCLLVESSGHWETFKESHSAIDLLKLCASLSYRKTFLQLLKRGVGVHRRHGGASVLEHVFTLPAVEDEAVSMCQQVLEFSDPALLNQTNPTSSLGLIHTGNERDKSRHRCNIIKLTIEYGADPNLRTNHIGLRLPGLVYHLERNDLESACVLLEHGADPTLPCLAGWTALHMAAWRDATSFLSKLQVPKTPAISIDWERGCQHSHGSEVFHGVTPLHLTAAVSVDFLGSLLEKVPSIRLEIRTDEGLTALHYAALWVCIDSLDLLVSRGANVNARTADGRLALHIAAEVGNLGLVERLLDLNSETTSRSDGMTPFLLAHQNNHLAIIDRLQAHSAGPTVTMSVSEGARYSALAKAISGAIRAGNLSSCQRLLVQQPSVDIDMPDGGSGGCTPLGLAARLGSLPIVKWLLENGANANCHSADGRSAIQEMIKNVSLNPVIQTMLDKYLVDGGCVLSESTGLIYLAVDASNTEGLSMLLSHLRENENEYCQRVSTARPTVIERAVNQKVEGSTPLHQAIKRNNQAAVRLLIDNGADIEATDSLNRTPLLLATEHAANIDALSIVRMLIQAGSNIACRDDEGAGPLSRACASLNLDLILYLIELDVDINTVDQTGLNALHFLLLEPDGVDRNSLLPSMFLRLTQMLIDPYQPEKFSWSALQLSMQRRSMTTFLLNGEFHTWKFAPMPWSTTPRCRAFPEVACLTSGFRLYRRKMSFERFRELLNTEFADAWSPLCRAAAIGNTEVMKNLLSMGSVIDYEGCPEGSALMIASRAGLLDSVIFLTRHGASISFQGRKQYWSAVDASARSMRILRWLLVDRFTDQFKLKNAPKQSDISTEKFKKWSGITKAEMVIVGPWERRASESSPNYWSRLEQMRQDFHGKVVPLRQGAKTRRQSKLVPAEPVRIAAGGYNSTDENR